MTKAQKIRQRFEKFPKRLIFKLYLYKLITAFEDYYAGGKKPELPKLIFLPKY